jgi:hypothetical protein
MNVELREGLESIDKWAFRNCTSLQRIRIPSTVKVIGEYAFSGCSQLMHVELREGLESIGQRAFRNCTSLQRIRIPSTVKVIGRRAFYRCTELIHVVLREGLERIDRGAFDRCTSLERISIPFTVHCIHKDAFRNCSYLVAIEFCEEVEEFVTELTLRPLWNNGTSKLSLWTGPFLAKYNIPERVGMIKEREWKANILAMLQRLPTMSFISNDDDDGVDVNDYDDEYEDEDNENNVELENDYSFSFNSQLANYEHLQDAALVLELALWKLKITERSNDNLIDYNGKLMCRIDSLSMVSIIIPNVLSFLVVEY